MAQPEYASLTDRIGGQKTIVLVVVCGLLLIFMVAAEVVPALGIGGTPPSDFVQFRVGGETVEVSYQQYQIQMGDWQRFHRGLAQAEGRFETDLSQEHFQRDLMLEGLAREAGIDITDRTLVDYIHSRPYFQSRDGNFDTDVFQINLESLFSDISIRGYENAARRHLAVDHYRRLYATTYLMVTDAEAWEHWRGDHPKVAVTYTWQPVAPLRAALGPGDVSDEEVEQHWGDPAVQNRHKLPPRYAFDAVSVRIEGVENEAYEAARTEWAKTDGLEPAEEDVYDFFLASRQYEFDPLKLTEEQRLAFAAENPEWREAVIPEDPPEESSGGTDPGVEDEEDEPLDPEDLDDAAIPMSSPLRFAKYFRYRLTKELWLRNVLEHIVKTAVDGDRPLAEVAAEWSREGVEFRVIRQETPVDQYEVEEIDGLGGPNSPTRYALNGYRPPQEGTIHPHVLDRSAQRSLFDERGWVAFQVQKVLPTEVPPLADVRDELVEELLDRKAEEKARERLESVRTAAESSGRTLAEAAEEKGLEHAALEGFNEYSWRPPLPRPADEEEPTPPADRWQTGTARINAVMGKYHALRETAVGTFAPVMDDVSGTGAFYLVQVDGRDQPAFEEMTEVQKRSAIREIRLDRFARVAQELEYPGLKDRLGLRINGEPAPEPQNRR